MSDVLLLVPLLFLHLLAMAAGAGLLIFALRDDQAGERPADEDGGDGGPPVHPPRRPDGGPPLADARPSDLRLRGPGRPARLRPRSPRRAPAHPAPARPGGPSRDPGRLPA